VGTGTRTGLRSKFNVDEKVADVDENVDEEVADVDENVDEDAGGLGGPLGGESTRRAMVSATTGETSMVSATTAAALREHVRRNSYSLMEGQLEAERKKVEELPRASANDADQRRLFERRERANDAETTRKRDREWHAEQVKFLREVAATAKQALSEQLQRAERDLAESKAGARRDVAEATSTGRRDVVDTKSTLMSGVMMGAALRTTESNKWGMDPDTSRLLHTMCIQGESL